MHFWHDFHITGYTVNGAQRELAFDLLWPYESASDVRRARIVFGGVEAYHLEHDLGGNIVHGFAERPLREFLEAWAEHFALNCKYGWPRFWRSMPHPPRPVAWELEAAHQSLAERGAKCIELASSYGLSGWVVAATLREEVIVR